MEYLSVNLFAQINYWAVIVVALLMFFLGGLWYSPVLFETQWMNANGYSAAQARQLLDGLGPLGFGSTFLAYLAVALVMALLVTTLGASSVAGGMLLGFAIWIGFMAPIGLTVNLFSVRPLATWLIDAGFQLIAMLMCGATLAMWR